MKKKRFTPKELRLGDIIELERGMKVFANLPSYVTLTSTVFSEKGENTSYIEIGMVCKVTAEEKKDLIKYRIKEAMSYFEGVTIPKAAYDAFISALDVDLSAKVFDTSVFAGIYQVVGMSGGSLWEGDEELICKNLADESRIVKFSSANPEAPRVKILQRVE